MNAPTGSAPNRPDDPSWLDGQGPIVAVVLLGLGLILVGSGAVSVGNGVRAGLLAGGVVGGAGLLYGIWGRRRAAARLDAARADEEAAREALQAAQEKIETLEEMSTARSQFLEEISHTFRRPLTLTLGPIDALLDGQFGALSDEVRTQLRLAERNGTRLLWLVNQLLDLAELETGSMSLVPTEGHLPRFVARSLQSFEDLAERRGVRLGFESSLDAPTAWFDEANMERMLANLLSGAFRVAGEGGSVQVAVRPVADAADDEPGAAQDAPTTALELVVEHTGAQEVPRPADQLFGTGDEASPHPDPEHIRTGLGLRLVGELADLHGGKLRIDRSVGSKVRYVVRLPRRPAAQHGNEARTAGSAPAAADETAPNDAERGPLALSRRALARREGASDPEDPSPDAAEDDRTTVLVIDDNSVICTLVRAHLEPEYRVREAHDGAEGYALARSLLPDLVITDVMMPEVDGFELCRKIKEDPDIDHVPVVFLTARADVEDKVEGLDVGADAYLTKPFEPEELIARTENLIATRQTLRASFRGADAAAGGPADGPAATEGGVENAKAALPSTAEESSLRDRIEEAIAEHLTDPDFGVAELAAATALSASQLRRRMKTIYDRTPVQLIRRRRLEAGARLLKEREDVTIGEVAYAVGFNSQSYFSRSFRDEFDVPPSEYRSEGVTA